MSNIISRLGAVLSLDTKGFVAGVDAAQQKSKEFKKQLKETQETLNGVKTAFFSAGAAFTALAAHAIHAANDIQDLADANETTVGKVIELQQALQKSGGEAENAGKFYEGFTQAIDGAAQGNDKLRDTFKELGISTHDLGFLTNEELKTKAIEGLSKVEDVVRRNAMAASLFSKAAKGVDFVGLNQQISEGAGHYDDMAKAVKDAADTMQKIEGLFHDMEMAATLAIQPVIKLFSTIPTENRIEAMTKAFQILGTAIAVSFGVTAVSGVIKLGSALRLMVVTNPWLLALTATGAAAAYFKPDLFGGGSGAEGNAPSAESNNSPAPQREIKESAHDKIIKKYKEEAEAVQDLAQIEMARINNSNDETIKALDLESKKYRLTQQQYDQEKLYLDNKKQLGAITDTQEKALADALKQKELSPAEEREYARALYDTKVEWINKTAQYEKDMQAQVFDKQQQNLDAEYKRQQSWAAGWDDAYKQYAESSVKAADRGAAAFNTVITSMDQALSNFVQTGKLNFKDLVGSIIKDLMLVELKAQASGLFKMGISALASAFGSSGGGGSGIGSMASLIMGTGKAAGGYIDRPTLVGEQGAELFIPRTPGTVIPNGSWQQMAGGGNSGLTVNGTYVASMNAIDTQSATQFLASNKNTIWAAYQSANRGVPISR